MAETMQVSAQRAWTHLKKYQPLIHELVSRDLKVKYRRSFLGYIWSILNPLLMMLLQSIIFSYMFRNDIPNFPLYLICGNTLFTFFNETTSMGLTSVIQNAPLIKKVYIPKFIFPISQAVSRFVTMLFSFGAVLLVMIFTRATFYWTIFLSWLPLVLLFFFSCGLGLLLSALAVYFRDMMHLYSILTMGWMYATPLFYPHRPAGNPAETDEAEPAVPLHQPVPQPDDVRQHSRPQHLDCLHFLRRCLYGYWPVGVPQAAKELYPVYLT